VPGAAVKAHCPPEYIKEFDRHHTRGGAEKEISQRTAVASTTAELRTSQQREIASENAQYFKNLHRWVCSTVTIWRGDAPGFNTFNFLGDEMI
jgi:hypothetical protein